MFLYGAGAQNQPIEVHERWYPFLYEKFEVAVDSSGDGRYRGGYGSHRRWRMLGDAVNSIHGDREGGTPPGVAGGANGGADPARGEQGRRGGGRLGAFAGGRPPPGGGGGRVAARRGRGRGGG